MLTPKQEAFCLKIIRGANQTVAYRAVYDCVDATEHAVGSKASTLARKPAVAARIASLREGVAAAVVAQTGYTLADALREAEEARELAHEKGQASAAASAVTLKSKLSGLLIEKKEITTKGELSDMDIAGLKRIRDEVALRIKASADADELTGSPSVVAPSLRRVVG